MNYGRGFPLPSYENKESWIAMKVIPQENGLGQNQSSWTASMFGGQFPQVGEGLGETPRRGIVVDEGIIRAKESESWKTAPVRPTGNGIGGHRDSWKPILQENGNGFVQNDEIWNPVVRTNSYSYARGNNHGNGSWTPVTPAKQNPQKSNLVTGNKPRNQMENGNWGDLVGLYQDMLQKETLNLNEVAQDHYQNNAYQNQVSSTSNRELNHIVNSARDPSGVHNLNPNHGSNQASSSISYFPPDDPANWDYNLLAAIVKPKASLISDPFKNRLQNDSVHNLNPNHGSNQASSSISYFPPDDPANWDNKLLEAIVRPKARLISDPFKNQLQREPNRILNSPHVPNRAHALYPNHGSHQASSSVSYLPPDDPANWDYKLLEAIVRPKARLISDPFKNQLQNNSVHDLNKIQTSFTEVGSMPRHQQSPTFIQKDGFPVPCRPCYDLNSPPRSELDAVSSSVTAPLPFAPITTNTQQKGRHESERTEEGVNQYIRDSTSLAVSTTQKEHVAFEEGANQRST